MFYSIYIDHADSFGFLMSSVAQLETELSTGRGGIFEKNINPDLIKLSKKSANVNNCILSEIFILNYKSLECKLSDLWYLKVEPKYGAAIRHEISVRREISVRLGKISNDCFWNSFLYERTQSGVMKIMNEGKYEGHSPCLRL